VYQKPRPITLVEILRRAFFLAETAATVCPLSYRQGLIQISDLSVVWWQDIPRFG
jgi:hypothetical protein